jgi:hypothetical protein
MPDANTDLPRIEKLPYLVNGGFDYGLQRCDRCFEKIIE